MAVSKNEENNEKSLSYFLVLVLYFLLLFYKKSNNNKILGRNSLRVVVGGVVGTNVFFSLFLF
jgi:hypothetical protein